MKSTVLGVLGVFLAMSFFATSGCDLWMLGSEKTGYRIKIETDQLKYGDLKRIEELLAAKGYKVRFRERIKTQSHPDEVYSSFKKTFIAKGNEEVVDIYLHYVKDESNNLCRHLWVDVKDWVRGGIVPELKAEIDDVGNLIYQEIVTKVGKEQVAVKRFGKVAEK